MSITSLASYTTVNSGSTMTVSLASVSHIIEHQDTRTQDTTERSCWIHFDSGKSVHVQEDYRTVQEDLEEYHKTHH
jgi:hypothetical protein